MTEFTTYDPTADFAVGKAINFEMGRAWYNNPLAIAEGADSAPRISRRAIQPGGAEIDGVVGDGTVMPTLGGYYEWSAWNLTAAKTLPWLTIGRINGNSAISSTISVSHPTAAQRLQAAQFLARVGGDGGIGSRGGGGGSVGAGGAGAPSGATAGASIGSIANLNRAWLSRLPILGGKGATGTSSSGTGGEGGGALILLVNGNLDLTGATISVAGEDGDTLSGAGAGGSIIIICNGTITGGTFDARGGDTGGGGASNGGGGGGGYIALIAAAFAGIQTMQVTGGSGYSSGGAAGLAEQVTLTEAQINGLLLR